MGIAFLHIYQNSPQFLGNHIGIPVLRRFKRRFFQENLYSFPMIKQISNAEQNATQKTFMRTRHTLAIYLGTQTRLNEGQWTVMMRTPQDSMHTNR
jgi:hypothetical protein